MSQTRDDPSDPSAAPEASAGETATAAAGAPDGVSRPPRLSQEIGVLLESLKDHPVPLREIFGVLHGRAYTLLLILLALPFCLPVPLIGLSSPFGLIISLIGLRLSLRQEPWLPRHVLDRKVSRKLLSPVLSASQKVVASLEFLLRPRWAFLVDFNPLHHLYGVMIFISGILLPLPIPFTNLFPAATVVLLAAALLERDGYFVIAGTVFFVVTVCLFSAIFFGGAAVVRWLKDWFGDLFDPGDERLPIDWQPYALTLGSWLQ